ncbi:MAG: NADH-quinone oxidoreductase subunit C [Thermoplasmata archaeon]|jgi:NADH-quinone oxidoreductase subunit C|nr:NADH-quinone oxidoreductase subunit C [Thermoplasmata archaeon]
MNEEEVTEQLKRDFPKGVSDFSFPRKGMLRFSADRDRLKDVCTRLKDIGFEQISLISALDWREHFECVYHITSYSFGIVAEVHTEIPLDDPKVDSVTPVWPGANFHEREAYDMMGIVFEGHPDLRRILLPDDFTFYPLRKNFREGE